MRTLSIVLLIFLSLGAASAQFEGLMEMKTTANLGAAGAKPAELSLMIQGNKLAADVKEVGGRKQQAKMIFRGDKEVMWVVDDANKSYMEISVNKDEEDQPTQSQEERKTPALRKTGKSVSILGYACEEWVAEDSGSVTSIWGTPKLSRMYDDLYKAFGEMKGGRNKVGGWNAWGSELARLKIFPLKIVRTRGGAVVDQQEVTKIEPKTLSASLFEIPAGYTKNEMGNAVQQMLDQLKKKGMSKDGGMNKDDMQKMLQDLQEKMKKAGVGGQADTSQQDNQ